MKREPRQLQLVHRERRSLQCSGSWVVFGVRADGERVALAGCPTQEEAEAARLAMIMGGIEGYSELIVERLKRYADGAWGGRLD